MPNIFEKFRFNEHMHQQMIEAAAGNPLGIRIDEIVSPTEAIIQGRHCIMLGSNNYLGLTFDEDAINNACEATQKEGTGTTGSRAANGSYADHQNLEQQVAEFFNCKHAMVFTTGYQANVGFLSAIAGKDDVILIDSDSHASIYDGCKLSNATTLHFRHNDPADLERRLKRLSPDVNKLVVLEGIYSMLGDCAPLKELVTISKKYGAYVVVDEAHSLGVLGENGRGLVEEAGVEDQVDFIVGTFSKSVGTIGGFCVSNHPELESLRLAARAYVFTASLPPSIVASASTALKKIKENKELRTKLWKNATQLYDGLKNLGYTIGADKTPITAIYMPNINYGLQLWRHLIENGVYVNLALPPATPKGVCLLRCSVSTAHNELQLARVLKIFEEARDIIKQDEQTASENHPDDILSISAATQQSKDSASETQRL